MSSGEVVSPAKSEEANVAEDNHKVKMAAKAELKFREMFQTSLKNIQNLQAKSDSASDEEKAAAEKLSLKVPMFKCSEEKSEAAEDDLDVGTDDQENKSQEDTSPKKEASKKRKSPPRSEDLEGETVLAKPTVRPANSLAPHQRSLAFSVDSILSSSSNARSATDALNPAAAAINVHQQMLLMNAAAHHQALLRQHQEVEHIRRLQELQQSKVFGDAAAAAVAGNAAAAAALKMMGGGPTAAGGAVATLRGEGAGDGAPEKEGERNGEYFFGV